MKRGRFISIKSRSCGQFTTASCLRPQIEHLKLTRPKNCMQTGQFVCLFDYFIQNECCKMTHVSFAKHSQIRFVCMHTFWLCDEGGIVPSSPMLFYPLCFPFSSHSFSLLLLSHHLYSASLF